MSRYVACAGDLHLEYHYEVSDLGKVLAAWGTGLAPGGQEMLPPGEEARLRELLPGFGQVTERRPSGTAFNIAYALNRLDIAVALLGRLGADPEGDFILAALEGVEGGHLHREGSTGRNYILKDPQGRRVTLTAPNANEALAAQDLPLEVLASAAFVHFSATGEESLAAQRQVAQRLAGRIRLIFEPGESFSPKERHLLDDILDHTETLVITASAWQQWGGELSRHPDWGPPVVLLDRGPQGVRLLTPVRYLDFPAVAPTFQEETPQPRGVFAAGYIAGLHLGLNLPQAVRLACALAAYSREEPGGRGWPDRRVLDAVVASLR